MNSKYWLSRPDDTLSDTQNPGVSVVCLSVVKKYGILSRLLAFFFYSQTMKESSAMPDSVSMNIDRINDIR